MNIFKMLRIYFSKMSVIPKSSPTLSQKKDFREEFSNSPTSLIRTWNFIFKKSNNITTKVGLGVKLQVNSHSLSTKATHWDLASNKLYKNQEKICQIDEPLQGATKWTHCRSKMSQNCNKVCRFRLKKEMLSAIFSLSKIRGTSNLEWVNSHQCLNNFDLSIGSY